MLVLKVSVIGIYCLITLEPTMVRFIKIGKFAAVKSYFGTFTSSLLHYVKAELSSSFVDESADFRGVAKEEGGVETSSPPPIGCDSW